MEVNVQFTAKVDAGPSVASFLLKYETLFDKKLVYELRKGAPLLQMLEAPDDFVQGSTEPWIVDIVCALLKANDKKTVLECGSFIGATTERLAKTLADMGGGTLVAVEIDPERAATAQARLEAANLPITVDWKIVQDDVIKYIQSLPDESLGFAWVDDDHEKPHVFEELSALLPKMQPGGIITGHDVDGSCDLRTEFAKFPNSLSLALPRLGPAGGIGIIQV